jgi:uncharacterized protein with NRDE domain
MCLIIFDWQSGLRPHLRLIANRDEFYSRPSLRADYWQDNTSILGGRDQKEGGTWLALSTAGRFAAVTNYREISAPNGLLSRGLLPVTFLNASQTSEAFAGHLITEAQHYAGFNALFFDGQTLCYFSNRPNARWHLLESGIYGLSNAGLDTPWPKLLTAKRKLQSILLSDRPFTAETEALFESLKDKRGYQDKQLPETGVGIALERLLSPIFIKSEGYGTRTSTLVDINGSEIYLHEREHIEPQGETDRVFNFKLSI